MSTRNRTGQLAQRSPTGRAFTRSALALAMLGAAGCGSDTTGPDMPLLDGASGSTSPTTGVPSTGAPVQGGGGGADAASTLTDASGAAPTTGGGASTTGPQDAGTGPGSTTGATADAAAPRDAQAPDADGAVVDAGDSVDPAWPEAEPEEYGLDTQLLEDAADRIQRATGNRYGMVVIREGVLVFEKYWQGGPDDQHVIYSCTKSWGSTLIGIAVTQGLLTVQDEVRKWVPEPAPGVSEGATLEHVLTQSAHTTPPGRSFGYNSGYLLNTAPEVLMAAAEMSGHEFFQKNLAEPLGLSMVWPQCPTGGCAGTRYPEGFVQFGNQPPEAPNADLPVSSVRDQAKLGWLWANDGVWRGQRLVDSSYITTAASSGAGPRRDYGYLWWLEGSDRFSAIGGVGNCFVNVMPSKKLVIAVLGDDAGLGRGGGWADFDDIVDALD